MDYTTLSLPDIILATTIGTLLGLTAWHGAIVAWKLLQILVELLSEGILITWDKAIAFINLIKKI